MYYKYGKFSQSQISEVKKTIRKSIFFLLVCVDEKTNKEFVEMDVEEMFRNLMYRIGGLNSLLNEPTELVFIQSLLQSALNEYKSDKFDFKTYRKLILDAGSEVLNIKEV